MNRYTVYLLSLFIAGCGVDVATSTATVAAGKAEEAKQAQKTKEHMTNQINNALAAGQQRLQEADKGSR